VASTTRFGHRDISSISSLQKESIFYIRLYASKKSGVSWRDALEVTEATTRSSPSTIYTRAGLVQSTTFALSCFSKLCMADRDVVFRSLARCSHSNVTSHTSHELRAYDTADAQPPSSTFAKYQMPLSESRLSETGGHWSASFFLDACISPQGAV
jgi:hypothetical protein